MHIYMKISERHKVDSQVMNERIDENHPWVLHVRWPIAAATFFIKDIVILYKVWSICVVKYELNWQCHTYIYNSNTDNFH